jgi:hypothetical protein
MIVMGFLLPVLRRCGPAGVMATMRPMPIMQEMHQRAGKKEKIRKRTQRVRRVLGQHEECSDR